ncbi:hypothetical protein NDU88_005200 [Pleurodeles waltl]|uniref:Uncharacterized protein n=1 Tax=Pleurodeles waltl TaxID=8319 RepID=A0AAV7M8K8_PLEWA|nr:hypothetical protein NDU88_005200 [Pleurodeles waltl]
MGKDRANKGTQQTRMDQYTAQNAGASLQKDPPGPSEKGAEPTGAQILAAIESSSRATQTQIAAIAVDVNLLRADLRNDGTGTPEFLWGKSGGRLRGPEEVRNAERRSTRCHCASRGSRVTVRSDGTLSLERRRQERKEAKLLVQTVTSEASSRSGSPCVASGLSPEGEAKVTSMIYWTFCYGRNQVLWFWVNAQGLPPVGSPLALWPFVFLLSTAAF